MKLTVDKTVFDKFSKLNVGVIVLRNIDNKRNASNIVPKMLDEMSNYVRNTYVLKGFSKDKNIANWKKAYGKKFKESHTAVENMMHDVLLGKDVPLSNNLTDLYRFFMLKYLVPIGGDDLDKIKGDVKLKLAEGWESLKTENGSENPKPGELIYMDDKNVLARRWRYHESKLTKITHNTKNAVIYFDGLYPITYEMLENYIKEFISLEKSFCNGKSRFRILNLVNTKVKLM